MGVLLYKLCYQNWPIHTAWHGTTHTSLFRRGRELDIRPSCRWALMRMLLGVACQFHAIFLHLRSCWLITFHYRFV